MLDFTGQTIIVTGAAGNLGAAIAETLGRLGANLALADMREEPVQHLAARIAGDPLYGRIVHIAAGAGAKSFAGAGVYAASKAAVMRVTEAIAEENKANGVTANCIMPSTIDTPQNRASMPDADFST